MPAAEIQQHSNTNFYFVTDFVFDVLQTKNVILNAHTSQGKYNFQSKKKGKEKYENEWLFYQMVRYCSDSGGLTQCYKYALLSN